jgi:NAD(P)H-hydrate epimerase
MASSSETFNTGFLNAQDAASLDAELMKSPGFTLEQLMELAGLSVAEAVYQVLQDEGKETGAKILVICGPGNNGGDGLVAARHLVMFGHEATVVYPKRSSKQPHYENLVQQCEDVGIPVLYDTPVDMNQYDAVVDAIFGFSFQGDPRPPFDGILEQMKTTTAATFAVDIPSGWDVNGLSKTDFTPTVLISLTVPKLCAQNFQGRHFIGGRFLPPALASKYNVRMPPYDGASQVWEMTSK